MALSNTTEPAQGQEFILKEYDQLRAEILKHIDTEYQLAIAGITAFGVIAALAVSQNFTNQGPVIVFLYPILALLLSFRWRYVDHRVVEIGTYIKVKIETAELMGEGYMGWEHYLDMSEKKYDTILCRHSVRGIYTITELLAILLGILLFVDKLPNNMPNADFIVGVFLFVLAVASFFVTNMVFVQAQYGKLDGRWYSHCCSILLWRFGRRFFPFFKDLEHCSTC
jgi:hypothetical protein